MTPAPPVLATHHADGAVLRLVLNRPKGNILDSEMVEALRRCLRELTGHDPVRAIVIEGAGHHFSFGASVEEHLPEQVAVMLGGFHGLFRDLIRCERPLLAVVRGQCLGGGLELASFCHRVFSAPDAHLGQAETRLGVFAPVASLVLPHRIGQARADDLLLTGRTVDAHEAQHIGLVDEVADDPLEAARAYVHSNLLPKSAASLRVATHAARYEYMRAFLEHIGDVEALYLDRLMKLSDAEEGIRAFLEKRQPAWSHA